MKNKKLIINLTITIIVAVMTIAIIFFIGIISNSNFYISNFHIKSDIPYYMRQSQPKTAEDKEIADSLIKQLENKYNTNFTMTGVAYKGVRDLSGKEVLEVSTVYAYSDEYPNLYISNDTDIGDKYLEEINAYNFKKDIYAKAKEMNIKSSLIAVDVGFFNDYEDKIFLEMFANKKIKMDSIENLFKELLNNSDKDEIKIELYTTEKGNNKKYEEFMRKYVGINDNYIKEYFGNYEHKEIIVTKNNIIVN